MNDSGRSQRKLLGSAGLGLIAILVAVFLNMSA
jgi:hypothetical protein